MSVFDRGSRAYDHDLAVAGGVPEMVAVVATQPVGPAAGEPKPGPIKAMELGDDLVEDRTRVGEPGAALVEAVEEQCRAVPLGLVDGSEELAHGNPDAAGRRGLLIERGGLAGARFADEDVGGDIGEGSQGGGVGSRRTVGVADGRDGPGREVDHGRGVGGAWQVVLASTAAAIGAPRCTTRKWGPSNPPTRVWAISMSQTRGGKRSLPRCRGCASVHLALFHILQMSSDVQSYALRRHPVLRRFRVQGGLGTWAGRRIPAPDVAQSGGGAEGARRATVAPPPATASRVRTGNSSHRRSRTVRSSSRNR